MSVPGLSEIDPIYHSLDILKVRPLDAYIYLNYGNRNLRESVYYWIEKWTGDNEDYASVAEEVKDLVQLCYMTNRNKWVKLYESTILEFNPLYNVDATEQTTRTLEQDGTVTIDKTGTETSKKTGTESNQKTGTETSNKTGTEKLVTDESIEDSKTGTETMAKSGSDTTTYNTIETAAKTGTEDTEHQSAKTTTESVTTTESATFYDAKKTVEAGAGNDNTDLTTFNTENEVSKTGTDAVSHNTTDTMTYNTQNTEAHDKEDTTTFNTQDQVTHNTTDQLTHNTTDQLTHNTTDETTRDLIDTEEILVRRFGNIGVTKSTDLLESFRQYVTYNVMDVVARDIADAISEGVY